jgi:hypothetical protein
MTAIGNPAETSINSINTLFQSYSNELKTLGEHERTEVDPRTGETYYARAKDAMLKTGEDVRRTTLENLNNVHEILMGHVGAESLLKTARDVDIRDSKSFLNHYLFMRAVFLRYWVAQIRGIALLTWISEPTTHLGFLGEDHKDGTKGPISLALENLRAQEKLFNNIVGPQTVLLCRQLISNPGSPAVLTIFSEPNCPWDIRYLEEQITNVQIWAEGIGKGWRYSEAFNIYSRPVVMRPHDQIGPDESKYKCCLAIVDADEKTQINANTEYHFRVGHADGQGWVHFGDPLAYVADFAVWSVGNPEWSVWKVTPHPETNNFRFQYVKDDWETQKGWWLNCHWGAKISWGNSWEGHTAVLEGIKTLDDGNKYQRFRIDHVKYDAKDDAQFELLT